MSRIRISFVFLFLFLLSACGTGVKEDNAVLEINLEGISFLVGKWVDAERPNQFEEWKIEDKSLIGTGYYVRGSDTTFFEQMTIRIHEGQLVFIATVRENQGPVYFYATHMENNQIAFENRQHDFPKYILYTLKKDPDSGIDILEAEVGDGERGLTTRLIRF